MVTETHHEEEKSEDDDTNDFFANFEGETSSGSGRRRSSASRVNRVNTSGVSGGYEKKKGFTAKKSDEKKPYSEDNMNGF